MNIKQYCFYILSVFVYFMLHTLQHDENEGQLSVFPKIFITLAEIVAIFIQSRQTRIFPSANFTTYTVHNKMQAEKSLLLTRYSRWITQHRIQRYRVCEVYEVCKTKLRLHLIVKG